MRRGRRFGKLLITTCSQPAGAPLLDTGLTTDDRDQHYVSLVVRHGRVRAGTVEAWVVAWRTNRPVPILSWRAVRRQLEYRIRRFLNVWPAPTGVTNDGCSVVQSGGDG